MYKAFIKRTIDVVLSLLGLVILAIPMGIIALMIVIDDPGCCRKTFENYFQVLDQVIQQLTKTN